MKKLFTLCLICLLAVSAMAQQSTYVDLGLPSGTLWKAYNDGAHFTYHEAVHFFGDNLPTQEQYEELKAFCDWQWTGSGCEAIGPNGNSIYFPASGYRLCTGVLRVEGVYGHYWSRTSSSSDYAVSFTFGSLEVDLDYSLSCFEKSVRLVK